MKLFKTASEIAAAVSTTAREIDAAYAGASSPIVAVCVLKGALHFYSDLTRRLHVPLEFEFIRASSYGNGRESSGRVEYLADVGIPLRGRSVLIVEDIVETGRTLAALRTRFLNAGAADVKIAALLDKPNKRKTDVPVEFRCFTADDLYLVGYGLDDAEKYRELPDLLYVD